MGHQASHSTDKLITELIEMDQNDKGLNNHMDDDDIDLGLDIDISTDTDRDTDDDNNDDNKLNVDHLPLQNIATNYDDNEFVNMPYEKELIERLSIALTYLLHHKSPLWHKDKDHIEYEEDILLLTPRTRQTKKAQHKSFQQKCMEYTVNGNLMGNLKTAQKKLNTLYDPSYRSKWKSLHHFWKEWTERA